MNDLTIIENKLAIVEEDDKQWVDARTLHEVMDVGRDFSTWIKARIEECGFEEGEDYFIYTLKDKNLDSPNLGNQDRYGKSYSPNRGNRSDQEKYFSPNLGKSLLGRPTIDYHLSPTTALQLAATENFPEKQAVLKWMTKVIKAWNDPEKIRQRALQMGVTVPGSRRPLIESAVLGFEKVKKWKGENVTPDILTVSQWFLENYTETGNKKDKVYVKDVYDQYCSYAKNPLPPEEFAITVSDTFIYTTCWKGILTGLKKITKKED